MDAEEGSGGKVEEDEFQKFGSVKDFCGGVGVGHVEWRGRRRGERRWWMCAKMG